MHMLALASSSRCSCTRLLHSAMSIVRDSLYPKVTARTCDVVRHASSTHTHMPRTHTCITAVWTLMNAMMHPPTPARADTAGLASHSGHVW